MKHDKNVILTQRRDVCDHPEEECIVSPPDVTGMFTIYCRKCDTDFHRYTLDELFANRKKYGIEMDLFTRAVSPEVTYESSKGRYRPKARKIGGNDWQEPCSHCKYSTQACAYIMDGKKMDDACIQELHWLRWQERQEVGAVKK